MNKVVFLITARLKSTRLKKKIIKKIKNKPMICHMIDNIKKIKQIDEVIVCTSTDGQDNELVNILKKNSYKYYRGSKNDVFLRLTNAAKKYNAKYIINIPADNPLVDPINIKKTIIILKKKKYDFVRNYNIPIGLFCYGMTMSSMKKICMIKKIKNTEVWYKFYTHTKFFKVKTINKIKKFKMNCRLTVDYIEDFLLIKKIIEFYEKKDGINIYDIKKYFNFFPKDKKINLHLNKLSHTRFKDQSSILLKDNIKFKYKVKKVYKDFIDYY